MKRAIRAVCLGVAGVAVAASSAVAAQWQLLGERLVDFRKDTVAVTAKPDAGAFAKIKIEVKQANMQIANVKVVYSDGESSDVKLDHYFGAGSSRVVDLPAAKQVASVELTCRAASSSSEGRVGLVRVLGSN